MARLVTMFQLFRPSTLARIIADLDSGELDQGIILNDNVKGFRQICVNQLIEMVGDVRASQLVAEEGV